MSETPQFKRIPPHNKCPGGQPQVWNVHTNAYECTPAHKVTFKDVLQGWSNMATKVETLIKEHPGIGARKKAIDGQLKIMHLMVDKAHDYSNPPPNIPDDPELAKQLRDKNTLVKRDWKDNFSLVWVIVVIGVAGFVLFYLMS